MNPLTYVGLFLLALSVAFAWPGYKRQSIEGATMKAFLVVVWPLLQFLLSLMLGAESKKGAIFGALHSYQTGKVVLLPIVLWAIAGLYAVEVLRRVPPPQWAAWGILSGAVVSIVTVALFLLVDLHPVWFEARPSWQPPRTLGELVCPVMVCALPGYVAAWYSWRAWRLVRDGHVKTSDALWVIWINAPFWLATAVHTRRLFDALPPTPPTCFIVTAATRGHPAIVGPFVELAPGRRANRQLARFWRFEAVWRRRHPASHAAVRRVYDRIAPSIAARIRFRWQADVVYLALKPLELVVTAATSVDATRDS